MKPPIEGCDLENVFFMRTPEDAIRLRETIDAGGIKKAVVVGAGYIGLEIAENLKTLGVRPFVLDMAPQILAPGFDKEMADYAEGKLSESGIPVVTGVAVTAIEGNGKVEKVVTYARLCWIWHHRFWHRDLTRKWQIMQRASYLRAEFL